MHLKWSASIINKVGENDSLELTKGVRLRRKARILITFGDLYLVSVMQICLIDADLNFGNVLLLIE